MTLLSPDDSEGGGFSFLTMHTADKRVESAIFLKLMNETNICKICNQICGSRQAMGTGLVSCHRHCSSAQKYFPIFEYFFPRPGPIQEDPGEDIYRIF